MTVKLLTILVLLTTQDMANMETSQVSCLTIARVVFSTLLSMWRYCVIQASITTSLTTQRQQRMKNQDRVSGTGRL